MVQEILCNNHKTQEQIQGISGTSPVVIHTLIFPSKIWAKKKCTLYMAKYSDL